MKTNLELFAKADSETGSVDLGIESLPTLTEREEQLKAQIEAIKAQAAEDKAIAEAKIRELSQAVSEGDSAQVDPEQYLEQLVQVQLIKDNERYKDDVVIGINGHNTIIKRGIPVMIKRKIALILESSYRQQMIAADLQSEYAESYNANSKIMG